MTDESLTQTEIRNALRWLVRHALTSGAISGDMDYKEYERSLNESVDRIFRCGSHYVSDDPDYKIK